MPRRFSVSFDYLCPFARNGCEHVVSALRDGADWDVTFVPYSLSQGHVPEGETPVWEQDAPDDVPGILALQVGLTVRDHFPERFLDVHEALFAARHDEAGDIKDPAVLADVLKRAGTDPDEVFGLLSDGRGLELLRREHDTTVQQHGVWGVPTFITDTRAVFVRIMDRPDGDAMRARQRIDQILELVDGSVELNEFKQVNIPR